MTLLTDSSINQLNFLDTSHYKNETRFNFLIDSETSNYFLGIDVFLNFPLCGSHYFLKSMINREKKKGQNLVKHLLSCYAVIVPITFNLIGIYLNILTRYSHPPWIISGHWFCVAFEGFCHTAIVYIGGFSLFVAVIKYFFIVHSGKAINFGENKARKICLISHLVFPIIMGALNSISNGRVDQLFWIDHCWSHQGWRFNHLNMTNSEKIGTLFCINREYEISDIFGENLKDVITKFLRVVCGGVKVTYLIFLSNILEVIIYVLIFKYLNR